MRLLILFIIIFFDFNSNAQTAFIIKGKVTDEQNNPLAGASVRLPVLNKGVFTDENGNFNFRLINSGNYEMKVSYIGYKISSRIIQINDSKSGINFILNPITNELGEIKVVQRSGFQVSHLDPVINNFIVGGSKNELINMDRVSADISQKNTRQIFAKIPGVFVYDMDGSGNQVNIATRGLDPHRSWEFNVRMDNVVTNSDMYGYPASHFSMPMEAVSSIELIHGTAALQYGAQFGGMINYKIKQGAEDKKIAIENISSIGSYGLKSNFTSLAGTVGKFSYYAYFNRRVSEGYRSNANSDYDAEYASGTYQINKNNKLTATFARSNYIYRIPGPLTEREFKADPRQSSRTRNYYTPDIYVPSLHFQSDLKYNFSFDWILSAVLGDRKSVQFTGIAGVADVPTDPDKIYAPRQVDIDQYHSYTSEATLKKSYEIGNLKSTLVGGIRLIKNDLHRRQKGVSDLADGPQFSTINDYFGRDLNYLTDNMAFYMENMFQLNEKLSVTPGFRIEQGITRMRGRIDDYNAGDIPTDIRHKFPLFGLNFNYLKSSNLRVYGGIAQAYRPVIFADIIPANPYELTDKNLKDAYGYNAEIGMNGNVNQRLFYELTGFLMNYKNKMGKQAILGEDNNTYIYRTNIGNARNMGLEIYLDYRLFANSKSGLSIFTSSSFMHGRYTSGKVKMGDTNVNIKGNIMETVPVLISRNGITYSYRKFRTAVLYSYTSSIYSDPINTWFMENGTVGLVPAYGLFDCNSSFKINNHFNVKLSLNNLTNKIYYTKRPSGYPGPGIWTSDGRSMVFTLQINY